ncbi:sugar ABC transporter permease [Aquamicrobium sp. LC103]|uniref:carbohydrate ABC transporter permease n=1 Tax=Aquamicrobium sp. LC103 TaxID=1120658 RepID=UPI00063E9FAC|nr:sugar ABC transporter permease [Aquamicrobium sp. LC103]TKT75811.1 sugar ABC transporter permease [Aquamicrobium sp. LC103]
MQHPPLASQHSLDVLARRARLVGSSLVGPALLLVVAINILPAIYGFYLSLHEVFFFGNEGFAGLKNYTELLRDSFAWQAIGRSLLFTFASLAIAVPLALLAAMGVRRLGRWGSVLLTVLLVPWAMSPIVVALLWKWILVPSPGGLVGAIFTAFGMPPQDLLTDPVLAMPTLIIVAVWRNFAFATIILIGGLGQIPRDLYKAASVDGLDAWESFCKITLPLLAPSLLIVISMLTISYFNEVQLIIGLTGGGPIRQTSTLAYSLYHTGFVELNQGKGNAIAVIMFLINMGLIAVYIRILGKQAGAAA